MDGDFFCVINFVDEIIVGDEIAMDEEIAVWKVGKFLWWYD